MRIIGECSSIKFTTIEWESPNCPEEIKIWPWLRVHALIITKDNNIIELNDNGIIEFELKILIDWLFEIGNNVTPLKKTIAFFDTLTTFTIIGQNKGLSLLKIHFLGETINAYLSPKEFIKLAHSLKQKLDKLPQY